MASRRGRTRTTRVQVPTPEVAAARWERGMLVSATTRSAAQLDQLVREVQRIAANLDHLHGDVTALREAARVPRPECYPDLSRKRAARVARRTPPAPEPPPDPPSPETTDGARDA